MNNISVRRLLDDAYITCTVPAEDLAVVDTLRQGVSAVPATTINTHITSAERRALEMYNDFRGRQEPAR